jgi:hypothetical protein
MKYKNSYIEIGNNFLLLSIGLFLYIDAIFMLVHAFLPLKPIVKLIAIKYIFLIIFLMLIAVYIFSTKKIKVISLKTLTYSLINFFIISIYFILSDRNTPSFVYFYQYASVILPIIAFSIVKVKSFNFEKYLLFFRIFAWIIVLFGLLEFLMPLEIFWGHIFKINDFWAAKGDFWSSVPLEQQGRFFSYELSWLFGEKIRRLTSIYADPTRTGPIISLLFNMFYFLPSKYKLISDRILLVLLFMVGILTFSKFFYITVLIVFVFELIKVDKVAFKNFLILVWLFLIAISFILFYILDYFTKMYLAAGFIHLIGFYDAILHFNFWGYGLGHGGNFGKIYGLSNSYGAESSIGALISQLGISSVFFILLLNSIANLSIRYLKFKTIHSLKFYFSKFVFISLIQYIVGFTFSESFLSSFFNILFFTIIMSAISICRNFMKVLR